MDRPLALASYFALALATSGCSAKLAVGAASVEVGLIQSSSETRIHKEGSIESRVLTHARVVEAIKAAPGGFLDFLRSLWPASVAEPAPTNSHELAALAERPEWKPWIASVWATYQAESALAAPPIEPKGELPDAY